jgi:hypothetical protein
VTKILCFSKKEDKLRISLQCGCSRQYDLTGPENKKESPRDFAIVKDKIRFPFLHSFMKVQKRLVLFLILMKELI